MGPVTGPRHVLVVADDLTGANATAAGLARAGIRAVTVTDAEQPEVVAEFVARFDAVVVSTNNRHAEPAAAAELARRAMRAGSPAALVANRIDSTLRGNVGATTQAMLEELRGVAGREAVALCVPAHPEAKPPDHRRRAAARRPPARGDRARSRPRLTGLEVGGGRAARSSRPTCPSG